MTKKKKKRMQFTLYACSFWGHFGRKIVAAEMSALVMSRLIRAFKLPAHLCNNYHSSTGSPLILR